MLGEHIINLRKAKGISQEQLAETLNVSRQSVSKWENGSATPDLDKIVKMAEYFEVSLDELIKGEEIKNIDKTKLHNFNPNPKTKAQSIGITCIITAAVLAIIFAILFGVVGLLFILPVLIFGLISYFAKNYPLLKASWTVYLLLSIFFHFSTAISPYHILHTFMWEKEMNYFYLAFSWIWFIVIMALLAWTANTFKKKKWSWSNKHKFEVLSAILIFVLAYIPWTFLQDLSFDYIYLYFIRIYLQLFSLTIIVTDFTRIIYQNRHRV